MSERRTARQLAELILKRECQYLEKKYTAFEAGDPAAALTKEEWDLLMSVKKLEQEGELIDAEKSYLAGQSTDELQDFYDKLSRSLN
jgi:hypothetical protein